MKGRKIKILRVMRGLNYGGIELRISNLQRALNRSGDYDGEIVTIVDKGELFNQLQAEGLVPVRFIPIKHRSDMKGILTLRNYIRDQQFDIVHTHSFYPNVPGRIAAKLAGAPVIIAHQHSLFSQKCKRTKHKWYEKILAPFTDKIIAVSHCVKEDYVNYTGVSPQKVEVIYNGIDLEPFTREYDIAQLKQELGIEDRIIIGSIGRIRWVKNYPALIAAADKVRYAIPNVVFIIAGDGPEHYKKKLISQIQQLNLQDYVKLIGYREDVPALIQMFDICVLPSRFEGFPGVVLEFLASRKPIVATNSGGHSEILKDGENGLLVTPGDVNQLAQAIVTLIKNQSLKKRLIHNAWSTAQEFSLEKMTANFDRLYNTLLSRTSQSKN